LIPTNLTLADVLRQSFIAFVRYVWKHVLGLPKPTRIQEDIARFLESGSTRRAIQALRGIGKSFLTCAYVVWRLWKDNNKTVLIVSAGETGAADNASLIKGIIYHEAGDKLWGSLRPGRDQKSSTLAFDVGGKGADKQPSVKCIGITGQLPGNRADIIIGDDVENPRNSWTEDQRDKLRHLFGEFSNIIKPLDTSEIIVLGTPQTAESIYNGLPQRGYTVRIWTARYPLADKLANYGAALAPMLLADIERDPKLCEPVGLSKLGGAPTDPDRFTDAKLIENELDGTAAEFMLQMMLDVTLSDAERYPLKTSDLIVMDVDPRRGPVSMAWTSAPEYQIKDVENVGWSGDRLYRPFNVSELWSDFTGSVMHIDPSGSGKDETAYVVTKFLGTRIYIRKWGGFVDGTSTETLTKLAEIARDEKVNLVMVEDNFGDGMFRQLLSPILARKHPCKLEGHKVSSMKEKRIVGALEPVMKQHRLVIDLAVVREDLKADSLRRGLFQMTNMTVVRGALRHDDRIDVLAQAAEYWRPYLNADEEKHERQHLDRLDREFEKKFFAGTNVGSLLNEGRVRARGRRMR
jgi:hypothetical protein